ncbi:MAG TPA: IS481 family transposase [Anaeromyxobacter sp.]|nr:IS481 family transposase [Anaeromyxobacter sp.]
MPWMETHPVLQRHEFIASLLRGEESMAELCQRFGISRKTGYKWKERFEALGPGGLDDLPRIAKTFPHRTTAQVERQLVALKRKHPSWGPKKLVALLRGRFPDLVAPAASTAGDILKRHGLVEPRRRPARRPRLWKSPPLQPVTAPNDTWSIDFKGHFRLSNRAYCYPLTVQDNFSRYLLRCVALPGIDSGPVEVVLDAAFREFGLPRAIRSDNGTPFAANRGCLGLSALSLWWLKLGIRPERIERGRPQQNGRHERMHRTLKAETTRPPTRSFSAQQTAFDDFRREYNEDRPHEALQQQRPADVYRRSPRAMPKKLPALEYPTTHEVRRVAWNGNFSYEGQRYYLTAVLAGENVGLTPLDDSNRQLWIGELPVGYIDLRTRRFTPYAVKQRELEAAVTAA